MDIRTPDPPDAIVNGRAAGAIFLSVFGAVWLLLGAANDRLVSPVALVVIAAMAAAMVFAARRLRRPTLSASADPGRDAARRAFIATGAAMIAEAALLRDHAMAVFCTSGIILRVTAGYNLVQATQASRASHAMPQP